MAQNRGWAIENAHPAIILVPKLKDENLPPVGEVENIVTEALEDYWGKTSGSFIRGVYRDTVEYQDEYPPEPPIEIEGIVISFGQLPIFAYNESMSPFRVVTNALEQKYNGPDEDLSDEINMVLDAIPD